jgi:hypothetical protein
MAIQQRRKGSGAALTPNPTRARIHKMVAIRCTAKLLKRFGQSHPPEPLASSTTLGAWFANSFTFAGRPHVLFTSERALLSVVLPLRPQATIVPRFRDGLRTLLRRIGIPEPFVDRELAEMSVLVFAATNSRRVLGSMKEFLLTIKLTGPVRLAWLIDDFQAEINDTPCRPLAYASPSEVCQALFREGAPHGLRPGQS